MLVVTLTDGNASHRIECGALLFDMDGTLVDSGACVERVWRLWAERHGLDIDALLRISHGRQNAETMRLIAPHLDTPEEHAFLEEREEACEEGIKEVAGARALLASLPPGTPWALVTSAWRTLAEKRMGLAGLPMPDTLVPADAITHSKPHPEGYLRAAELLDVAPADCLVFEDAHAGVEAARAAGMRVIGVTTTFAREDLPADWHVGDLRAVRVERQ